MSVVVTKKGKKGSSSKSSSGDSDVKTVKIDSSSFFLESDKHQDGGDIEKEEVEVGKKGSKIEASENEGSENEESENEGSENEESENEGSENEGSSEELKPENKESVKEEESENEENEGTRETVSTNYTDTESEASSEDEEIIDIRQNQLYQVFACLLEDEKGDNLVEVLAKINENLEKHNQHLENLVEKVTDKNDDKLGERFDRQNKILARMAKSLDTYLNKKNNNNNNNNNQEEEENEE